MKHLLNFEKYRTFLFDCDGVILNSNQMKAKTFYEIAIKYGKKEANDLIDYHKQNGGLSRFKKFAHFFHDILKKEECEKDIQKAIDDFGKLSYQKMLHCQAIPGVFEFIKSLPKSSKRFIVSGGAQKELREVFQSRKQDILFDGIFGSPDSKMTILQNLFESEQIDQPAIFFGDGRYDYQTASKFNLDFVFISGFTGFQDWKEYFHNRDHVTIVETFQSFL